jgi:CRISPR-associated endonuclease/helicase Cas3
MEKLSAYTEFLSHPKEQGTSLKEHLLAVARVGRDLVAKTKFSPGSAFYAGLLHDFGKLNPFYQEIFHADRTIRPQLEKDLLSKYERQHSIFSAWAALYLLQNNVDLRTRNLIVAVIAGHHSALRRRISIDRTKVTLQNSQRAIADLIADFKSEISNEHDFTKLNWEACQKEFLDPISFQSEVKGGDDGTFSFLEACVIFSALLQADRGSFDTWSTPVYDLKLDTSRLARVDSKLGSLRKQFQQQVQEEYDASSDVSVIHAPTGIGKTKVFLDLISKYIGLERVIYFSPLLALTEDFEKKVKQIAAGSLEDILVYNHLFSGILSDKDTEGYRVNSDGWNFENDSFNSKFIITTTQRLLLTLYSNSASDKLKLISLKNSLLIVDEIQVVPKFLLPNFIGLLREICKNMNSKVLLVSATVPQEVRDQRLPIYSMSEAQCNEYHRLTMKKVVYHNSFSLPEILAGKVLLMANTRRKAKRIFDSFKSKDNVHYLTTGVRKKTRAKILDEISSSSSDCLVVSTQVVEAGVDISFSEVYREVAPLDNIIQVMGRLSREGEVTYPVLHIFSLDSDHRPYVELEYKKSLDILQAVQDSRDLYDRLGNYYEEISTRNLTNKRLANELLSLENMMDFDQVWQLIRKYVFDDQEEPVLIPESEGQAAEIRQELLTAKKIDRNMFKKYAGLVASLPRKNSTPEQLFDSELTEKNILFPKQGKLSELYDNKVGLDKWLT